jgi:hypothetical protein
MYAEPIRPADAVMRGPQSVRDRSLPPPVSARARAHISPDTPAAPAQMKSRFRPAAVPEIPVADVDKPQGTT